MGRYLLTIGGKINALRDGLYRQGARPDRQQAGAALAAALAIGAAAAAVATATATTGLIVLLEGAGAALVFLLAAAYQ